MGQELSVKMKDIAKTFFKGEVGNHTEYMATFAKTILEEHEAENADGIEFEHEVKVSFDYQKGLEYEVISPEADEKATNDLNIVESNLTDGINQYLKEEEVITTPVEIEVNEDGKFTASTQALTSIEAKKVESVLDLINQSLDEVDSTVALREEESKFIQEAGNSKTEDEAEDLKENEDKSDIELLGDKFTQKIASRSNIDVDTGSEIGEAKKLESLITGNDSTNNKDSSDKTDTIQITIGEASSDAVRQSLADRIMDKLPDGLQGIFEEALKINDILGNFHNKNSLMQALA